MKVSLKSQVVWRCALTLGCSLWSVACSTDDSVTIVKKVPARSLDVKDSTLVKPEHLTGDDQNAVSIDAFARTVYPIVEANCVSCHNNFTAPYIANESPVVAHNAIINAEKVNYNNPANSRLVLRLAEDNHNCWGDCQDNAAQMTAAIEKWLDETEIVAGPSLDLTFATDEVVVPDMRKTVPEVENPPGTFAFEAESGVMDAPFAIGNVGAASGGKFVHTLAGGGATSAVSASQDKSLGSLKFVFNVAETGNYALFGRVLSPGPNADSFHLRMDGGALQIWDIQDNDGTFQFHRVMQRTNPDSPTPLVARSFQLTAGQHTLEVIQREDGVQLDAFYFTTNAAIDLTTITPTPFVTDTLNFDISTMVQAAGDIDFSIRVEDYNDKSYKFSVPTITAESDRVRIKGVKILINGVFKPEDATYSQLDVIAEPGEQTQLSSAAMIVLKENGSALDAFSFVFDLVEVVSDEE